MYILHLFVVLCVAVVLMALPLYPFWKFWRNLKAGHPDIWAQKGPFGFLSLLSSGALLRDFIALIDDKDLAQQDPALAKTMATARGIWEMRPKTFVTQIVYVLVFVYFVSFFTSLIFSFFR